MGLKAALKRSLPLPVVNSIRRAKSGYALARAYRYDRDRFLRFSSSVDPYASKQNLASRVTESYHNIEKGLSLPHPRPGFGAEAIRRLVDYIQAYRDMYGDDDLVRAAAGTLDAYLRFNRAAGVDEAAIPDYRSISGLLLAVGEPPSGGTKVLRRSDVLTAVQNVDERFFASRSSVRQFADEPVDEDDVVFAVRAAQKSPAVCNRQFSRVYIISSREDIRRALSIQGGARGFAESVPMLAVITTNVRNFWAAGERMQPWTDGGMFAMSFVLGLHARALGSVCLNWSKTAVTDREFHAAFDIPDEEVIVMLIAFGKLRDEYAVALSPRVPLYETLRHL